MKAEESALVTEFRNEATHRMKESLRMIRICLSSLDDTQFWHRPNKASNGVGQLLVHLSGNIRQYIHSGLGGLPDTRVRDREFEPLSEGNRQCIEDDFFEVARQAIERVARIPDALLVQKKRVQGFELSGLGLVLHVVEHLSYHTGQIAYLTKAIKNKDLGFYHGMDLNTKNE